MATSSFSITSQIGQGGYGRVYKGILADGTVVAIKRAQQGSLQGEKEFYTEIELLSRVHHRNLVSLVGYCDEKKEQVSSMTYSQIHKVFCSLKYWKNGGAYNTTRERLPSFGSKFQSKLVFPFDF